MQTIQKGHILVLFQKGYDLTLCASKIHWWSETGLKLSSLCFLLPKVRFIAMQRQICSAPGRTAETWCFVNVPHNAKFPFYCQVVIEIPRHEKSHFLYSFCLLRFSECVCWSTEFVAHYDVTKGTGNKPPARCKHMKGWEEAKTKYAVFWTSKGFFFWGLSFVQGSSTLVPDEK